MRPAMERRRDPRYQMGEGAIAVLAHNPGHLRDISMGGISFVYIHNKEPDHDGDTVDIVDGSNAFFLEELPCRVVAKRLLINEALFSMMRMVHCSLQFGTLTQVQQAALATYLHRHARPLA